MAAFVTRSVSFAAASLLMLAAGCSSSPPPTYQDLRPPVDQLTVGNEGLQSKDVVTATNQMAGDLLSLPELNASQTQWTIVLTGVQNHTTEPVFSYDAFNGRLRAKLAQLGHGRVALIENKANYQDLQNQELSGGAPGGAPTPGMNPDYGLYITIDSMPNRASDYYLVTATLTNLHTRQQVWISNPYEVQTAR